MDESKDNLNHIQHRNGCSRTTSLLIGIPNSYSDKIFSIEPNVAIEPLTLD